MERTVSKLHFVAADKVDAAYGQHYRSPEIPGYAGIIVFDSVEQPCSVTEGDPNPRQHSGKAGDGYLDRFGGFDCSRCHRELAWSPNWVAEGVFGDESYDYALREMGYRLVAMGLAEEAVEVMARSLIFKSLYEAGTSEVIAALDDVIIQVVEPTLSAREVKPSHLSIVQ